MKLGLAVFRWSGLFAERDPMNVLIEKQIELEKLYDKNSLGKRVRSEFIQEKHFELTMKQNNIPVDFGYHLLSEMALRKRASFPVIAGLMRKHYDGITNATYMTAQMLEKCVYADLVDWCCQTQQFIVIYEITEDVEQEIELYQYPLPMVVQPMEVRTNKDTGYLVNSRGSLILRDNYHENDIALDHINRMNAIPLSIDFDVAFNTRNKWKNLYKAKPGESIKDQQKKLRSFEKYEQDCFHVLDELLAHENRFYLTHSYDKRGRTYCKGYHVNYQGTEWNKAVVQLHADLHEIIEG